MSQSSSKRSNNNTNNNKSTGKHNQRVPPSRKRTSTGPIKKRKISSNAQHVELDGNPNDGIGLYCCEKFTTRNRWIMGSATPLSWSGRNSNGAKTTATTRSIDDTSFAFATPLKAPPLPPAARVQQPMHGIQNNQAIPKSRWRQASVLTRYHLVPFRSSPMPQQLLRVPPIHPFQSRPLHSSTPFKARAATSPKRKSQTKKTPPKAGPKRGSQMATSQVKTSPAAGVPPIVTPFPNSLASPAAVAKSVPRWGSSPPKDDAWRHRVHVSPWERPRVSRNVDSVWSSPPSANNGSTSGAPPPLFQRADSLFLEELRVAGDPSTLLFQEEWWRMP
jgi:hypothetical protein